MACVKGVRFKENDTLLLRVTFLFKLRLSYFFIERDELTFHITRIMPTSVHLYNCCP